ncbi:RNA-binding protein [Palaeococcus ferrophilus]|uniref:RNA-binding protein n=1 Tax=Palaeococcus ferrophilus TaxID=83868 RepID=UPI00064E260D|nr:RNA-binding protein [Palaeococcus ferrophilus]
MEFRSRRHLSKKDVKGIIAEMGRLFGEEVASKLIKKKDDVEIAEVDRITQVIFVNGKPRFIRREGLVFPLVSTLYELSNEEDLRTWKRSVVVDAGAVPYVLDGADVMAPGITDADEGIGEGDFVFVVEENFGRPLAIGIALMDGKRMKESKKGKAVKNIHHAKDRLWELTV